MSNDTTTEESTAEPTFDPIVDPVTVDPNEGESDACNATLCVSPGGSCDTDTENSTCVCNYGFTGTQCELSVVSSPLRFFVFRIF